MSITKAANGFIVILWVATAVLTLIWIFNVQFPYEPEPLTVLLALVSTAVTGLVNRYAHKLESEKFTVAHVLAKGYVRNFIEPVMTELIKKHGKNGGKPLLYIFIPKLLSDLSPKSIERLKVKLKEKGFQDKTEKVVLSEGRGVRDIMSVKNNQAGNSYFDFPNTLFSLTDFVDYKMNSPKDSLDENLRCELGMKYIDHFKNQLTESLQKNQLYPEYVKFIDTDLSM